MTVKLTCIKVLTSSLPIRPTTWSVGPWLETRIAGSPWSRGFSSVLESKCSMCLCFLPSPPNTTLLSLFRNCLEVVRLVSLEHKTLFFTLICGGDDKGRGEIGFQNMWSYSWKFKQLVTKRSLPLVYWNSGGCWLVDEFCLFMRRHPLCHAAGKVMASSLLCVTNMFPF